MVVESFLDYKLNVYLSRNNCNVHMRKYVYKHMKINTNIYLPNLEAWWIKKPLVQQPISIEHVLGAYFCSCWFLYQNLYWLSIVEDHLCVLLARVVNLHFSMALDFTHFFNFFFRVYARWYIIKWRICILFFHMFYAYSLKIVDLPKGMNEGCVLEGVLYRKRWSLRSLSNWAIR